ncbi:hypothetical protein OHR68_03240 [Spirillospora sp. NBC_00431]
MKSWSAALVLRFPYPRDSKARRRALETVLRAADIGVPSALRAVARELESGDQEAVWRTWLKPAVSGPSPQRWTSAIIDTVSPPDLLVDVAWQDWLDEHHAPLWSLLKRWNRPASTSDPRRNALSGLALGHDDVTMDADVLAEAASRFDHPIGDPARALLLEHNDTAAIDAFCATSAGSPDAIAFCVAHHLAPSDEVRCAVFFVRTGQHEQYRALDPDGALLALGYRSAPAETRAALREAMTEHGDIDALRVLAGTGSRQEDLASLTEQERGYLVQRLADRGDWERLWRLTVLLPLAEAADAVRAFGEWRPPDTDGRRLFHALRDANPTDLRARLATLSSANTLAPGVRFELTDLDQRLTDLYFVDDMDFAPDGPHLAFTGQILNDFDEDPTSRAGILDLERRALVRLYPRFPQPLDLIAHLGSDTVVVAESMVFGSDSGTRRLEVHYADRDGVRTLDFTSTEITGLERIPGDRAFLMSAWDDDSDDGSADAVFTADSSTPPVSTGITDEVEGFLPTETALDPGRRKVAVLDSDDIVVAELDGSAVNHLTPLANAELEHLALSPTVLICCDDEGMLHVWQEPLTAKAPSATIPLWTRLSCPNHLAWSPTLDRFVAVHDLELELLDIPPAGDVQAVSREAFTLSTPHGRRVHIARLSPDGGILAAGDLHGTIDLYALTPLALGRGPDIARPLGQMDHRILTEAGAALANPALGDEFRPPLELLRNCLEYRFRHDMGIGDAATAVAMADDDIELGG